MVAILGGTRAFIFKAVEQMYTEVATQPGRTFHFPTAGSPAPSSDTRETCSIGSRQRRPSHLQGSGFRSRRRRAGRRHGARHREWLRD